MPRCPLLLLPLVLATPLGAQALPQSVAAIGSGVVTFAYPTRPEVCGDGYVIVMDDPESPAGQLVYAADGSLYTGSWSPLGMTRRCDPGPARVRISVRERRVTAVRPMVGGAATPSSADRDLGTVAAADAVAFLLDVAAVADESVGRHALLAAAIADSSRLAPRLTTMARDKALRPAVREEALRWLGRTALRDGYEAEAERSVQTIAADSGDVIAVRDRAIRLIRGTTASEAFLRSLYSRLSEPALRDRVIRVLGSTPSPTTVAWIEALVLNDNETVALRERALRVLGDEVGDPDRVRAVYGRLRHDALKDRAVRIIGAAGDAASERWLLALAQDSKEPLPARDRAIRLLAEQGNYAQLRELYGRIQESALKDRVIRVTAEAGGNDNLRFLRGIVASGTENSAARDRALRTLAQSGLTTADLAALYDSLADHTLRTRVIALLAERGGDAAFDKLARIAREDADPDLRRQAARRLAQSGDPRAQAFFERTLKN